MQWCGPPNLVLLCAAGLSLLLQTALGQRALMSVDLGGEFMKIAIVKPGVPMEIVLNKESARKTRSIVAFRDGERHFANEAYNTAVRFPEKSFWFLTHIIGRNYDDPLVEQFRERFPYYRHIMVKDEDRGTVLFREADGTVYSSEELLGMMLEKAREYAQDFAEQKIQDVVITIPPYYTQAERRAVLAAAELVGLNVLQLMTDTAAVALHFGVFRRKNFNTSTQYYMFYDMGATSTVVSIVGYKMVKTQVGSRVESNPQLTVRGVGYDRDLGGLEMTLRLRDHLAEVFNGQRQRSVRVQDNPRAMAKLMKEAERVKKVLSANTDHKAQVEGLLDGEDFSCKVTREEYLDLIKDLLQGVTKPVEDALKMSEITWPEINEIILMGGGSRLPKVHDLLMKYSGKKELGKSINTDEAAALGAVYQAAYLGKGFKVKTFHVRDANVFPINVEFEKQKTEEDETSAIKRIKRTLFGRTNYYPQKKVMTFNKHYVKDFNFDVRYGDLDFLSEEERKLFPSPLLSRVNLKGVGTAYSKHGASGVEYKGVKAHFRMDDSGLLHLDLVESAFENLDAASKDEDSTWSKLGNAFGSMFGGQEEGEGGEQEKAEAPSTGNGDSPKAGDKAEKPKKADSKDKKAQKEKEDKKKKEKADKAKDSGKKTSSSPKAMSEKLKAVVKVKDLADFSKDKLRQAKKRLSDLRRKDEEKIAVEKAKNELEGFIIDAQDRLSQETYEACSTEEERTSLMQKLSEASDWLYEQPHDAKRVVFTNKRRDLKVLMKGVEVRVKEREGRPAALKALRKAVEASITFLQAARRNNSLSDTPPFTKTELFMLERLINDTRTWQEEAEREQKQRGDRADPSLLVDTIQSKVKALEREVKYLQNKPKKAPSSSSSTKKRPKAKANKTDSEEEEEKKKKEEEEEEEKAKKEEGEEEKKEEKKEEDEDATVEDESDEDFNAAADSQGSNNDVRKEDSARDSGHIEL
ncbi:hypoxia up-regulated protein 1-like isoform X2 [Babylonia areolata]|uniref:hypoxia up-regulated protein 1-like isoform X2 n=1 Tax=Babylonia areolata TaxID=304850 RepID=UPI003FD666CB